ncbi:DEAD/DEAH box helicase [Nguyenibacter sp. L1]|uniref:DEAD/DEAH box helicase n=1 Tax=Nguyenibacter sp. L1 TaxID=3049350 RepID=UPI002B469F26|nr:DEAD/DEAH box helicase [Nguyenibacter sp. L1]WRH89555.1 DEAD/DEAH box helicase [Nguyenibacter sp. L1]
MQLSYDSSRRMWLAETTYDEGWMPKGEGFKWSPSLRRWLTTSPEVAKELTYYEDCECDESTRTHLDATLRAAEAGRERRIAESQATDARISVPCGDGLDWMPYQRAGIAFALNPARHNVLLADDMGLGKTAQAIGAINGDAAMRRILIVCPASLTRNWQREIERFGNFGGRNLTVGFATSKVLPETSIVIATYDLFSRSNPVQAQIRGAEWDMLILDEAHYVKSRDSKRTLHILGGGRARVRGISASRRLYLTGTPIMNRPIELWPLIHSLAPAQFPQLMPFAKRYCAAHETRFGWDMNGASNLDELQRVLRETIMIRRLKSDVLTELPEKTRQVIELPADTAMTRRALEAERKAAGIASAARGRLAQAKRKHAEAMAKVSAGDRERLTRQYEEQVAALRQGVQVAFTEISRVRHETALAKVPMVIEAVRDAVEASGKVILFAHHSDVVEALADGLSDLGVVSITGSTPPAQRQGIVDRFQADQNVRVFIGNIQAAGVGLTLTASSHVIFAELDWTPSGMSQAEDRAHRLGQRNAVLIQHIVLEKSLDLMLARKLVQKQRIIDAALNGQGSQTEAAAEADDEDGWLDDDPGQAIAA